MHPEPPRSRKRVPCGSRLAFVAMTALATAAAAQTQSLGWKPLTAKQLAAQCHASEPAPRATCVGYVSGIYDLQFAPTPPRGVCPPPDFTPDLLAEVVTAYVDTHDDGPASAAVGQAVVRFFPCVEPHR